MVVRRFSLSILFCWIGLVMARPNFAATFIDEYQQTRVEMSADPHRPGYHFLPPAGWMDDANGVIQYNGQYHLFYQWIPSTAHRNGGPFHWGHAVSDDLVHWRDLPIAISPTPGGPDAAGCWSGSAVMNGAVPTILYTGRGPQGFGVCVATSDEQMLTWKKHPASPVIHQPPAGYEATGGDPHVWQEGRTWYCLLGSGIKDVGGTGMLYRSDDLLQWEFVGKLFTGRVAETGTHWELPKFVPLGDKYVLTVSPHNSWRSIYFVGDYRAGKFTPQHHAQLDEGGHFYAPYPFVDDQGRVLMISWAWEGRHESDYVPLGWSGVHTIARVLSLQDDGTLSYEPIEEIKSLRRKHWHVEPRDLKQDRPDWFDGARGDMVEIATRFHVNDSQSLGLIVRASDDGREQTRIVYDRRAKTLSIDRTHASLDQKTHQHVYRSEPIFKVTGGSFQLSDDEPLSLRVFVDRSLIEVYANERLCLTSRMYPTLADSLAIGCFAEGGSARLLSCDVWQMAPIWP